MTAFKSVDTAQFRKVPNGPPSPICHMTGWRDFLAPGCPRVSTDPNDASAWPILLTLSAGRNVPLVGRADEAAEGANHAAR